MNRTIFGIIVVSFVNIVFHAIWVTLHLNFNTLTFSCCVHFSGKRVNTPQAQRFPFVCDALDFLCPAFYFSEMFALLVVRIFPASKTQSDFATFSLTKLNQDCAVGKCDFLVHIWPNQCQITIQTIHMWR